MELPHHLNEGAETQLFKIVSALSWLHQALEWQGQKKKADLQLMYNSRPTWLLYDSLSPPTGMTMIWAGDNHRGLHGERRRWSSKLLLCSFITAACQSLIINLSLSPFASKVLCQDCDHSLQRSQHRPVDHHWPEQFTVMAEMRGKTEAIDKSIIMFKAKAATEMLCVFTHSSENCDFVITTDSCVTIKGNYTMCPERI